MNPNPMPIFIAAPTPLPERKPAEEKVPKRVAFAFGLVQFFSAKTENVIAGGGDVVAPQEFDGQDLDVEEKELFRASCKLMTSYVEGVYEASAEELEKKAERKKRLDAKKTSLKNLLRVAACPGCGGSGFANGKKCAICVGTGHVSLMPVRSDGSPV